MGRKWIVVGAVLLLIGGLLISASVSEHAAENKARSFCSTFKAGDSFSSALSLMRSVASSDQWVKEGKRLTVMFTSYDPQSVYACEIDSQDGKITSMRYRHLDQE